MPEFAYEAIASTGLRSQGTLTATSEREAMAMLDAQGLFPVNIAPGKAARGGWHWRRKIQSRYMATFYAQLADLLHSGVPILRSLEILERQSSQPQLSEVLRDIRARVADGTALAEAMSQHPHAFNELTVSMVRAGQEGGFLEDVLRRIADFTEHQEDIKSKVMGALAYPVFLAILGTAVLLVLVVFFVPQFEPMFKKLEEKNALPTLTVIVLGFSHILASWKGLVVLIGFIGVIVLYNYWSRTPSGRLLVDGWRLRMPLVGRIYLQFALSRFTRILGTMLHNGIPILHALEIGKDSTGNVLLAQAIEQSAKNVTAGDSLASPLAACKFVPRDVVEMIAVGEESNSLDTVLVHIAESLEKRTTRQLELFVRLLEPMMLLVMATITGLVVGGLLMPVFSMGSVVG